MTTIVNIPQRFQTVNSFSAIDAGIRMLPLLLLTPVASALSGLMVAKLKVPPLFVLLLGAALQCLGLGLFSSIDDSSLQVPPAQFGYQVLMGLGFGFSLSTILMMATIVVAEKDLGERESPLRKQKPLEKFFTLLILDIEADQCHSSFLFFFVIKKSRNHGRCNTTPCTRRNDRSRRRGRAPARPHQIRSRQVPDAD